MKRIVLFVLPLFLALIIFSGFTILINRSSGKGALQVTSVPKSHVYLNDKLIGDSPLCRCELSQMFPAGDYTIRLIPIEGDFSPFEQKITIDKATLTAVDRTFGSGATSQGSVISLSRLDNKKEIQLLVIAFPDKANVFLDSNLQGVTPILLKNQTASDHELSITKDGYKDKSVRISTSLGYKLTALVFLGVNPLSSTPSGVVLEKPSKIPVVQKIVILNTPTGFLRVRESNSITSSEISKAKPGENYELVLEKEGWFEIKLIDGRMGWVSSSYAVKQ